MLWLYFLTKSKDKNTSQNRGVIFFTVPKQIFNSMPTTPSRESKFS